MNIISANKLLRYLNRLDHYQLGEDVVPITMELHLTNRCNYNCPHCTNADRDESLEVSSDDARRWISEAVEYGVRGLLLSGGGEPTCHRDCAMIARYAHDSGMKVGLITNGGPVVDDRMLVENCEWIRVSLDAGDADMYAKVHGTDVEEFLSVKGHLWELAAIRQSVGSACTLGAGYLVNGETKEGMVDAAKMCAKTGIDYLQFRPYYDDFTTIADILPACRQYETDRFKIISSEHRYRHFDQPRNYDYCHGAHFVAVVRPDGKLSVCCHYAGNAGKSFANLHEMSFSDAWQRDMKEAVLQEIDVSKCVPLCRLDAVNRLLHDVVTPRAHEEFI